MTHTSTEQPEALNLEEFRVKVTRAAREPLLARIEELETKLAPAHPAAVAVPEGWALVPLEATQEMIEAWGNATELPEGMAERSDDEVNAYAAQRDWKAMLAVAPAVVAVPDERSAFEAWAESVGLDHLVRGFGKQDDYAFVETRRMWQAWKARAKLATKPIRQGLDARDTAFEAVHKAFCNLQRYSFLLDNRGNVRRCADHSGNWVEFEAVHTLFEPQSVDAAPAPKPPVATPVELPKPVGWFHRHPNECKDGELCNYQIALADKKDGWEEFPLYTEQQVRALLAEVSAPAAQAQRVPLSEEQRRAIFDDLWPHGADAGIRKLFTATVFATEAAHGITKEKP